MGGSAFSSGPNPLYTPRMPTSVYHTVKEICLAKLRTLFECVASPIDGPGKQDFGDVDILVAWPKPVLFLASDVSATTAFRESMTIIQRVLGAERAIIVNGQTSSNMAIPWPVTAESPPEEGKPPRFIQVDVRICDSLENLAWMLFKHAHGDIWNLL